MKVVSSRFVSNTLAVIVQVSVLIHSPFSATLCGSAASFTHGWCFSNCLGSHIYSALLTKLGRWQCSILSTGHKKCNQYDLNS